MDKKIRGGVCDLAFDEKRSRVYLLGPKLLHVYDAKTMKPIISLKRPRYANYVYIGKETDLVVIQSTEGTFMVYSAEDFTLLGQTRLRGEWNTDPRFYYDESENMLYGIANKHLVEHMCCVSLQPLSCRLIPLTPQKKEGELLRGQKYIFEYTDYDFAYDPETEDLSITPIPRKEERIGEENPYTRHNFLRYENGSFYMIRNFYNVGGVGDRIYECLFGRFEEENGTLVLKEKFYSTKERWLDPLDLELKEEEREDVKQFCAQFVGKDAFTCYPYLNFYRSERGLFLIIRQTLYRYFNGKVEKEYSSEYFCEYKEFEGRRYFGDWGFLHVQDIPKE